MSSKKERWAKAWEEQPEAHMCVHQIQKFVKKFKCHQSALDQESGVITADIVTTLGASNG